MPESKQDQSEAKAKWGAEFVQIVNEGLRLGESGQNDEAIALFRKAIALVPDHAVPHANLGALLSNQGKYDEALEACRKAVTYDPGHSGAYNNLGLILEKKRRYEESLEALNRSIALDPDNVGALNNVTSVYRQLGRLDEAESAARRAIALQPKHPKGHSNLGATLSAMGRMDEAIVSFRQAIALDPNLAMPHKNLGLALMTQGDFARGWREYDWRWKADGLPPREYPRPLWRGEDMAGKTLLFYTEQGLGDAIQFARFAPLMAERGARVILEVHRPLMALMRSLPGIHQVTGLGDPQPDFDAYHAAMSLPGVMGITPATIPAKIPYLAADPERIAKWRARLGDHGFKIGVVWKGKCNTPEEASRSAPLSLLAPLAKIEGVRLISLQKTIADEMPEPLLEQIPVEILGADFDSGPDAFLDTAAVMMCLDLVITIDTSIAHLAGALGLPVWIALVRHCDWRWSTAGEKSAWYPTARLFRQQQRGDWAPVFAEIARALRARVAECSGQAAPQTRAKVQVLSDHRALVHGRDGLFLVNRNDLFMGKCIETYGEYGAVEAGALLAVLSEGDTVIEAGANIGAHTVGLAKKVGRKGRVYAYEPQRACFALLQSQVALNELDQVVAIPEACGAANGTLWHPPCNYDQVGNYGGISMEPQQKPGYLPVPVRKLDDAHLGEKIRLIKADVEGMEEEVLEGARNIILKCKPILYLENDRVEKSTALISRVQELGYRAWWHICPVFNPNNYFGEIKNIYGTIYSFNIICLPAGVPIGADAFSGQVHLDQPHPLSAARGLHAKQR